MSCYASIRSQLWSWTLLFPISSNYKLVYLYTGVKLQSPLLAHCPTLLVQTSHRISSVSPLLIMPSCTARLVPFFPHTWRFPSDLSFPRTENSPHSYFLLQVDSSRLPGALSSLVETTSFRFCLFPASVPGSFTPTNPRQLSSPLRLATYIKKKKKKKF